MQSHDHNGLLNYLFVECVSTNPANGKKTHQTRPVDFYIKSCSCCTDVDDIIAQ